MLDTRTIRSHVGRNPFHSDAYPSARTVLTRQCHEER